jgi:recombination protein RecA
VDENRKKALVAALGQIEKQFGKGAVMQMLRLELVVYQEAV